MKKAVAIFFRDLMRILRNPVALVVTLGVCVVPCLYAWINVLADWNPYANTSDVPVAVANEDSTVKVKGMGKVCVGAMMVEELQKNDQVGWQFMDVDQAVEGVRAGTYYAAIVIPEDFTSNLAGVLKGDRNKAELKYYVNEKTNAIAPEVTDSGATSIEKQINEQFMGVASKVVVEKFQNAANDALKDSRKATNTTTATLNDVKESIASVNEQLTDLEKNLGSAGSALSKAATDLKKLEGTGGKAGDSLQDVLNNVNDVRTQANSAIGNINTSLESAANQTSSLGTKASHDVSAITADVAYAQSQVSSAIASLEQDLTDTQSLTSKATSARDLVLQITPNDEGVDALRVTISNQLNDELGVLGQLSSTQSSKLDELRGLAEQIESAADGVSNVATSLNDNVQSAGSALTGAQTGLTSTTLTKVSGALDSFVQVAKQLEAALAMVDPLVSQTVEATDQLATTLQTTGDALSKTHGGLDNVTSTIDDLTDELAAIQASDAWDALKDVLTLDPQSMRDFMTAPVELVEKRLYPVDNYGSGVSPFFTSVALWVGGIALVAIYKLEVDEKEVGSVRPWQAYAGRWLLFVLLGTLQAVACVTGNLIIGVQCVYPWAWYVSAIVASFAFVSIIFALSVAFKHIGKALAFTLVVLQVPGSAGMYPIEMMPPFFQAICPWLPFTYSNNAMREAIAGFYGAYLPQDLGMLLLFAGVATLVGVTARTRLVGVNALFDRRLRETDHLMVSEPVAIESGRYSLATVVKATIGPKEYRDELDERSAAFELMYPKAVRMGLILLFVVPVVLFAFMLLHSAKLPLLACWIVSIVIIYAALILLEFFHDRVAHKKELARMTRLQKSKVLKDVLREEPEDSAPIDVLIERRRARRKGGDAR